MIDEMLLYEEFGGQFTEIERQRAAFNETFELVMGYPPGANDVAHHFLYGVRYVVSEIKRGAE